jgi:hypothetical protein
MKSALAPGGPVPRRYPAEAVIKHEIATPLLAPLSSAVRTDFGHRPVVANHALCREALFGDAGLIELLDRFPRRHLYALSTGDDPMRSDQNRLALHDGVSGAELLRAVRQGRLWLNLKHVEQADPRCRALIRALYAELAEQLPGFAPDSVHGTLLISSPHALVYYHVDGPASVLWHLRGRKRVWVYPARDRYFVEREDLEDIFAGVRHEYLPYDRSFDAAAKVIDLEPGQWMAWAHNAPHRVTNGDSLNVSLSTEHYTPQGRRRARVNKANRYLRTHCAMKGLSSRETGTAALLKTVVHGLARLAGMDRLPPKQHTPSLRIVANAPGGVIALDEPLVAGKALSPDEPMGSMASPR